MQKETHRFDGGNDSISRVCLVGVDFCIRDFERLKKATRWNDYTPEV